jgi:acyl-CoA dehydrogenase
VRRTVYSSDHEEWRKTLATFFQKEVKPRYPSWVEAGRPESWLFQRAGQLGLLGLQAPEEFGGGGVDTSFKFNAIVTEELQAAGLALGGLRLHTDICMPYFVRYANEEQRERWLPGLVSGDEVAAIAISEPGTGSDMRSIATAAVRDGDEFIVNGAKTFISNGSIADLVIVVVRIDGQEGLSLLVVEGTTPGFEHGRSLDKIGLKAQDVAELFFLDARVPAANVLGEIGRGFEYLSANLVQERLSIALNSQAAAVAALATTLDYVKERKAFGTTIGSFQNSKFELAACATEVEAGQALADAALEAMDNGELTAADAAKVKLFCSEVQGRVVDRCLQLHGGYGYMMEQPIAQAYADARVSRIFGGSSEIMKVIIAKSLGL